MFAYCGNNPVIFSDPFGEFGLATLCTIGAVVGGLIGYAAEVIQNHQAGLTGFDAWVGEVNWGGVLASAFSGALSAIPNAGVAVRAIDVVGSVAIEYGFNALHGKQIDSSNIATDIVISAATSIIPVEKISRTGIMPQYICNIKDEARSIGVKGTKKLTAYLNTKQVLNITINSFYDSSFSELADRFAKPRINSYIRGWKYG